MPQIESLLSARLHLAPQLWNNRIYFISNLSGRFSLYVMDHGGSVPEPLLPPNIALQNPELIGGSSFYVYPELGKILVAIDNDGDENYRPMFIPIEGGVPEPAFPDFNDIEAQVYFAPGARDTNVVYLSVSLLKEAISKTYKGDLETGKLDLILENKWGSGVAGVNDDNTMAAVGVGYAFGDVVLYLWESGKGAEPLAALHGVPIEDREEGEEVVYTAFGDAHFTDGDRGLLVTTALFEDTYGLGYIELSKSHDVKPVTITGIAHIGVGEMEHMEHLHGDRFLLRYNIDGASWAYEGRFDTEALQMNLDHVICGQGVLSNGVTEAIHYDTASDRYILEFSTAASPTQIYTIEGKERDSVVMHTRERILGTPAEWLAPGEDASFTSYDGLRVSARLYLPSRELGFEGARPLVYYIHGGPQGQERPNFAWFSMPLIQFLTLNGFAVFVPNARGSSGYGLDYMRKVYRDWGGNDRLDHVHAMGLLEKDERVDAKRAGVIGRSYGGYMTLTLASRHPELWSAAVDMFGPYNLLTFIERVPASWRPYFATSVGDPDKEPEFLLERSPYTYMNDISAPLLVIQGANDPRVIERESRDVVEHLREVGKEAEYLVFENEGHDVIKYENKVTCYNTITDFFKKHLGA